MIECIHYDSSCFGDGKKITPKGIVLHSTGCVNTSLKRYVQPSKCDAGYERLISLIGKNKYKNSWNRKISKSVHYFVGKLADGKAEAAMILPESMACWGCGKGKKGSYNYSPNGRIQIEICEDNGKNAEYFTDATECAAKLCAQICERYGFDPGDIVSHKEAHKKGYASNHGDPEKWFKKHGYSMAEFRGRVKEILTCG